MVKRDEIMELLEQLKRYVPWNEQEETDRRELLRRLYSGEQLYTRENASAHLTASAWVVSPDRIARHVGDTVGSLSPNYEESAAQVCGHIKTHIAGNEAINGDSPKRMQADVHRDPSLFCFLIPAYHIQTENGRGKLPLPFIYSADLSIVSRKIPYPLVGSFSSTWVTAPTNFPF